MPSKNKTIRQRFSRRPNIPNAKLINLTTATSPDVSKETSIIKLPEEESKPSQKQQSTRQIKLLNIRRETVLEINAQNRNCHKENSSSPKKHTEQVEKTKCSTATIKTSKVQKKSESTGDTQTSFTEPEDSRPARQRRIEIGLTQSLTHEINNPQFYCQAWGDSSSNTPSPPQSKWPSQENQKNNNQPLTSDIGVINSDPVKQEKEELSHTHVESPDSKRCSSFTVNVTCPLKKLSNNPRRHLPPNVIKWFDECPNYLCEPSWIDTTKVAAFVALKKIEEDRLKMKKKRGTS